MSEVSQEIKKEESPEVKAAVKAEKERIMVLLMKNSARMAADYRATIKHTGGLLTQSMTFAYSRALNDTFKLISKETKDEKSVQS